MWVFKQNRVTCFDIWLFYGQEIKHLPKLNINLTDAHDAFLE